MVVYRLNKDEAHRIAIHAQLLDVPRPTDLPAVIAEVRDAQMRASTAAWLETNEPFRRDILALLEKEGPLLSRDIPDTSVEPWPSSGWTNNRNITRMLESLALRGQVAISGRKGRQRYWDLPERVYPADLPTLDLDAAVRHRNDRRLIHDRVRTEQLFGFEYILEMYKPKEKRRWGYFALPVLHGDRLVGKLDATADHKAGTLVVNAIHEDVRFTKAMTAAAHAEIDNLAAWLGLEVTGA